METRNEVTRALAALFALFNREATPQVFAAYHIGLRRLSTDAAVKACETAMEQCEFCPPPAVIIKLAQGGSADDKAQLAWAIVDRAADHGSYVNVDFEDRSINVAVRALGGWPALLDCTMTEWNSFRRAAFVRAYAAALRAGLTGEATGQLQGLSDSIEVIKIACPETLGDQSTSPRLGDEGDKLRLMSS